MKLLHTAPWLIADLGAPRRVLSWTLNRPGFVAARRIVIREVRNRDLPRDLDAALWLGRELVATGLADAPALLTSRDISAFECRSAQAGDVMVHCLATVGLSNAERVGHRQSFDPARWGTINMVLDCSAGLTRAAQIEALTIAVQARTAAVIDAGFALPEGPATGTGTDCIALAAPPGRTAFAGLHTDAGESLGRAAYDAVAAGAARWIDTRAGLARDPHARS
ncbi:MAG TPA: adenosylcobinamide amidohydrolase [Amaricoccus sp.]|uniref:adenosylcobinamide amidohydrolase n=1 Tax=Amaricoccus sp. TaxID=1872485 RepID=UPI002C919CE4|nr:adenosylcobinamide amidohydrolase [Amaricoccus sp.]HMQ92292.1 adenosylcobinamide amidohydrolase [Amaricoccus sp.]HMR51041.1 adenosylcobinamide amidohydrolase [Amaricoccus sp.]HMR61330.1 adenosylcobinamide amidohydrolase [Amaricoccus sp.]HMT97780.1 adenosylcobinamide amidohydrolase [Amaricoccus sp.]